MDKEIDKKNENSESIIIPTDSVQNKIGTVTVIRKLIKAIKEQLKELDKIENTEINSENYEQIDGILIATDSLINDCYSANEFTCNKNDSFLKLIYLYQRISIRLETQKLQEVIKQVELKNEELKKQQNELDIQYNESEEKNNNLVYNLLGFLASFSIVSAAVAAIEKVNGTLNIMIVIAFAVFLLLTTLIGLHNFYKGDNKRESKLQDNYFLWKATGIIIVILMILSGINCIKNNKDKIFNYLDKKIENVIEEKINNKLEENYQ